MWADRAVQMLNSQLRIKSSNMIVKRQPLRRKQMIQFILFLLFINGADFSGKIQEIITQEYFRGETKNDSTHK